MSEYQSIGTAVAQRLLFNTGYVTFGDSQAIDVQDIGITLSFDAKELKAINSIKIRALKRANFKVEASFNVASHHTKLLQLLASASSAVANGLSYSIKDGQQDSTSFIITGFVDDDVTKPIQYQFTGAILTVGNVTKSVEGFEMRACTVVATDVEIFEDSEAAN